MLPGEAAITFRLRSTAESQPFDIVLCDALYLCKKSFLVVNSAAVVFPATRASSWTSWEFISEFLPPNHVFTVAYMR